MVRHGARGREGGADAVRRNGQQAANLGRGDAEVGAVDLRDEAVDGRADGRGRGRRDRIDVGVDRDRDAVLRIEARRSEIEGLDLRLRGLVGLGVRQRRRVGQRRLIGHRHAAAERGPGGGGRQGDVVAGQRRSDCSAGRPVVDRVAQPRRDGVQRVARLNGVAGAGLADRQGDGVADVIGSSAEVDGVDLRAHRIPGGGGDIDERVVGRDGDVVDVRRGAERRVGLQLQDVAAERAVRHPARGYAKVSLVDFRNRRVDHAVHADVGVRNAVQRQLRASDGQGPGVADVEARRAEVDLADLLTSHDIRAGDAGGQRALGVVLRRRDGEGRARIVLGDDENVARLRDREASDAIGAGDLGLEVVQDGVRRGQGSIGDGVGERLVDGVVDIQRDAVRSAVGEAAGVAERDRGRLGGRRLHGLHQRRRQRISRDDHVRDGGVGGEARAAGGAGDGHHAVGGRSGQIAARDLRGERGERLLRSLSGGDGLGQSLAVGQRQVHHVASVQRLVAQGDRSGLGVRDDVCGRRAVGRLTGVHVIDRIVDLRRQRKAGPGCLRGEGHDPVGVGDVNAARVVERADDGGADAGVRIARGDRDAFRMGVVAGVDEGHLDDVADVIGVRVERHLVLLRQRDPVGGRVGQVVGGGVDRVSGVHDLDGGREARAGGRGCDDDIAAAGGGRDAVVAADLAGEGGGDGVEGVAGCHRVAIDSAAHRDLHDVADVIGVRSADLDRVHLCD